MLRFFVGVVLFCLGCAFFVYIFYFLCEMLFLCVKLFNLVRFWCFLCFFFVIPSGPP